MEDLEYPDDHDSDDGDDHVMYRHKATCHPTPSYYDSYKLADGLYGGYKLYWDTTCEDPAHMMEWICIQIDIEKPIRTTRVKCLKWTIPC